MKLEKQPSKCAHIFKEDTYVFANEQLLLPDIFEAVSQLRDEDNFSRNCVAFLTGLACYFTHPPCHTARGMLGCSAGTCQDSNWECVCVVRADVWCGEVCLSM